MPQAQCKTCGKPLPKGAQFCGFCGSKVLDRCPKCGNTELPGPNFCIKCGSPLRGGTGPTAGSASKSEADRDDALEAELQVYKAGWEEGQHIITCPHCGAKNRIPGSKMQQAPSCGRCRRPLAVD